MSKRERGYCDGSCIANGTECASFKEATRAPKPMLQGEELQRVRLKWLARQGLPTDTPMTCDTCSDSADCDSAFDMYNTNGGCLEDK